MTWRGNPLFRTSILLDRTIVWYLIVHFKNLSRIRSSYFFNTQSVGSVTINLTLGILTMAAPTSRLPEHLVYPGQNQEIFSTRRKSLKVITAVRMRIIHTNRGNPCALWNIHPSKKVVEFQNVVSFFLWTFVKPKYFVKEVCHFSIILLEQNIVFGLNKMPLNFTTKLTPGRLHVFNFLITWVTQVTFWHWSSSVVRRLSSYNYNKIVKFMYPAPRVGDSMAM